MKILVTGCAGFIGSHLTEKLLDLGHKVIGVDNYDPFYDRKIKESNILAFKNSIDFELIEKDICDDNLYKILPPNIDIIVHLAAKAGVRPSINDPLSYINTNIVGTHKLLDWMKIHNVNKMIFASSSSVYGNNKKVPFSENDNVDYPISPYAATKKSCELLCHTYHHLYNLNIINLRFFTVFGPRQRPDLAIRKFIELIREDKKITVFGDGQTGRDYTYIDDIIDGIMKSIDYVCNNSCVFEIINLGNCKPVKLETLVERIYNLLNKKKDINYEPMQEGDVDLTWADISKAQSLLGYNPVTSVEVGLRNFLQWHESIN